MHMHVLEGGLVFAWRGGGGGGGCMWWVGACMHVCVVCVCNLPLETPFLNLCILHFSHQAM